MRLLATAAAAAGALAAAPAAHGATLTLERDKLGGIADVVTVRIEAAPGERQDATLEIRRDEVVLRDAGAPPRAGNGCVAALDTGRCPLPTAGELGALLLVELRAGDGDDRVVVPAVGKLRDGWFAAIEVDGDGGADQLTSQSVRSEALTFVTLDGGDGDDVLTGGAGDDALAGAGGRDRLAAGTGDDQLEGDGISDGIAPVRKAAEVGLTGRGSFPDPPKPAPPASDEIDGGAGDDTAGYTGRTEPLTVDLADGAPDGSPGEEDRLAGIENVLGGEGPNVLRGDGADNWLFGGPRADTIEGRGGDDLLNGLQGRNVLHGGTGDDDLVFPASRSTGGAGTDAIYASGAGVDVRRVASAELLGLPGVRGGALRLAATARRRGRDVVLSAVTRDALESVPGLDAGALLDSLGKGADVVAVRVLGPGGTVLARGNAKVPAGGDGRRFSMRARLTRAGRRSRARTVKVVLRSGDERVEVRLPLR